MNYPKLPLAQSILQLFADQQVRHIVIAPGSRNAPLSLGFAHDTRFTCYSIVDERCAAFFAMGIAQQTQELVAVVCTSGSAVLNFYPAVAEAFYSQIPLLIVSADRPPHKIDIGDGQTIRQDHVLDQHCVHSVSLQEGASPQNDQAIYRAITWAKSRKGPVHINAPFEEPLYQWQDQYDVAITPAATIELPAIAGPTAFTPDQLQQWKSAEKKIVLIGTQAPNVLSEQVLSALKADPSVVVLSEITSNVADPVFFNHIDVLITAMDEQEQAAFSPTILVSIGGMVVSKRIKALFRKHQPTAHWHIDPLRAYDTFGVLTTHVVCSANEGLAQLVNQPIGESNYREIYTKLMAERWEKHAAFMQNLPYSDLQVYQKLLAAIPSEYQLQLSNSAGIRYAQLFPVPADLHVYCNRGTSGIDGSTSTAIGASVGAQQPVVLFTGDVSFFYDSNALWNRYIPAHFRIVIINNAGGGIFRILPGHQPWESYHTFLETHHQLNASHLAAMYQMEYQSAHNLDELEQQLVPFYSSGDRPKILEIFTPELENADFLRGYFAALK